MSTHNMASSTDVYNVVRSARLAMLVLGELDTREAPRAQAVTSILQASPGFLSQPQFDKSRRTTT